MKTKRMAFREATVLFVRMDTIEELPAKIYEKLTKGQRTFLA